MRERLDSFWAKDGTKTVLASLASIVIGLLVGCIVIVVVGLTSDNLSPKSAWEGVRIVLGSIFSTGRGEGVFLLAELGISANFYRMLPYLITLIVLAFTSKSSRAPKAEGIPYDKAKR